jgi:hypothetical protein
VSEDHVCTLYCEGDVHAVLITASAGVPRATVERFAVWHGYVVHDARRVLEADLTTELAKRAWSWDPVTEQLTPYLPTDSHPTDEVWMVRISMAPHAETQGHAGGPGGGRWSRRWRWWRRASSRQRGR